MDTLATAERLARMEEKLDHVLDHTSRVVELEKDLMLLKQRVYFLAFLAFSGSGATVAQLLGFLR